MRVFFNFFIKTIALLTAVTVFFILLGLLISNLESFSSTEKTNVNKFIFKEGDSTSQNKIVLIELRGPILNKPSGALEFNLIDNIEVIYVSEFIKDLE